MFSNVWSENATLFERLVKIHSNPPILYYGFKQPIKKLTKYTEEEDKAQDFPICGSLKSKGKPLPGST